MRPEEELIKERAVRKRKKRTKRRIKFILALVIILTVIILFFYFLENPERLNNIKAKILSLYSSETAETSPDTENIASIEDMGVKSEVTTSSTPGLSDKEITDNKPVFLQKILDFFSKRMGVHEDELPSQLNIKLYFASLGEENKFVFEEIEINADSKKIAVESIMKELLNGPKKPFHYPVIPAGTNVLDIEIYENLAKINLSQEFLENSLDSGILDEYVIYTIVNTVTQVPGIDGVVFFIDGRRIKTYGEVDLSIPAIENEKFIEEN
jgi:hypothetical protein